MREARSQLIAEHVMLAISRSALTERTYAQTVADVYLQRTPLHVRAVTFAASADPYADSEANRQTVKRMLDGRVRMAVDIEEALILALPEPYRHHLQAELAERMGLMIADQPATTPAGQQHQVGDLVSAAGNALEKLSQMLDDGVLDAQDAAFAPGALVALEALQARAATLADGIRRHVLQAGGSLRQPAESEVMRGGFADGRDGAGRAAMVPTCPVRASRPSAQHLPKRGTPGAATPGVRFVHRT